MLLEDTSITHDPIIYIHMVNLKFPISLEISSEYGDFDQMKIKSVDNPGYYEMIERYLIYTLSTPFSSFLCKQGTNAQKTD